MKQFFTKTAAKKTAVAGALMLGASFLTACQTVPYEQRGDYRGAATLGGCGAGLVAGRNDNAASLIGKTLIGCAAGAVVGEVVSGPPTQPVYVEPGYAPGYYQGGGAYYGGGYRRPSCHNELTGRRSFSGYDMYGRPRFERERVYVCR